MERKIPRILITAAGSGSGKTTFTCGLLQALKQRNIQPVSFKCGPDYIDPMFHTEVLGIPSRNLDLFFSEPETIRQLMCKHAEFADVAVVEGVMGYYDGLGGISSQASAYDLSDKTETPAILLVDCSGKSVSILAEIKGFLTYKEQSHIKGVILNKISPMIYSEIKTLIEENLDINVYGYLPKMEGCSLESRHLGLITAKEVSNLKQIISDLATQIESSIDIEGLLELANSAPVISVDPKRVKSILSRPLRIAVAKDNAFCFYYQDNLDLLTDLGVEIVEFSPLKDAKLPDNISGLIFGGGYPELYLEELSDNTSLRNQIKTLIEQGMPCIAECGGFMYLHEELENRDGMIRPMAGAIKGKSFPTTKLSRFGYITLTAEKDTVLCKKGEIIKGHEFHYWDSTNTGNSFFAEKPLRNKSWNCIVSEKNILAGYPHLYFSDNPEIATNFVNAVAEYSKSISV